MYSSDHLNLTAEWGGAKSNDSELKIIDFFYFIKKFQEIQKKIGEVVIKRHPLTAQNAFERVRLVGLIGFQGIEKFLDKQELKQLTLLLTNTKHPHKRIQTTNFRS